MAYETEVKTDLFSEKLFSIDETHLTFDDTQMDCKDITGYTYWGVTTTVQGIKAHTFHTFRFIDSSNDELKFSFYKGRFSDESGEEIAVRIRAEIWKAFGSRIATETIARIAGGGKFEVGGIVFTKEGALLKHRPFFGKNRDVQVPWTQIDASVFQGTVTVRAGRDAGVSQAFDMSAFNAPVLLHILQMVANDRSFANVLGGR